ncbi:hypothetical protein FGADI_1650 [Fusarium gaditjirri]|uniref:PKS/mFAS DH domain-containing protein n=1 Tax=Fusarium gaditjirri TaxID=282569 RepID=A0A8H4TKI6_9HYPO|nr:hypothetical protein FGADI_1650 [Fusarium gaditjirri]
MQGHKLRGQIIFTAAGYIAMAIEAVKALAGDESLSHIKIEDLLLEQAISFNDEGTMTETLFSVNIDESGHSSTAGNFTCYSCPDGDRFMIRNAVGRIYVKFVALTASYLPFVTSGASIDMVGVGIDRFYKEQSRVGYNYTEPFKGITSIRRKPGIAEARPTLKMALVTTAVRELDIDMPILKALDINSLSEGFGIPTPRQRVSRPRPEVLSAEDLHTHPDNLLFASSTAPSLNGTSTPASAISNDGVGSPYLISNPEDINFHRSIIPSDIQPIPLLSFSKLTARQPQTSYTTFRADIRLASLTAQTKQIACQNQETNTHLYPVVL